MVDLCLNDGAFDTVKNAGFVMKTIVQKTPKYDAEACPRLL